MTAEEKSILLKEIPKYIQENCCHTDGTVKPYDLWLVGWVAAEFEDRKNAMKVLINNEYGLLGNLLNKHARRPDRSITRSMEQADLDILLRALREGGNSVLWRNELSTDPYAMRLLITHDRKFVKYVEGCLLDSEDFLLSVVTICPDILQRSAPGIFADEGFVFSLIQKNSACLKYLPRKFRTDHRLCLEAVKQEGFALMYVDHALRESEDIVLAAVSNRGNALSLATPRQKQNRQIVYAAVTNCGLALEYADSRWKQDFDLVSAAVENRGMALRYAAPALQDDERLVRLAVQNDGYAIRSASDRLRDDYDLAALALSTYPEAYVYLSPRLQEDPTFKHIYLSKKEEENKWLRSIQR